MPGLKAGEEKKKRNGLANITAAMEKRQRERRSEEETTAEIEKPVIPEAVPKTVKSVKSLKEEIPELTEVKRQIGDSATAPMYAKVFENKIGAALRRKYESGGMPRVHRQLYEAIVRAMNGVAKAQVTLSPILEELEITRAQSSNILACLEHYGYLRISRITNAAGRGLMFELLQE